MASGWVRSLLAVILLAAVAAGVLVTDYQQFVRAPLNAGAEPVLLSVEPGSSIRSVAAQLNASGVLPRPRYLEALARLEGYATRIQAGEYDVDPNARPRELLEKLVSGKVRLYGFTVVEGWTFRQLMLALAELDTLRRELVGLAPEEVMRRIGSEHTHPEGWFLPDTYLFPRGTSDVEFLRRAHKAMQEQLAAAWQERADDLPLEDPYQVLILASIVEKETAVAAERPEIAGVFVRRLRRNMRLQTDPTVIYGLGDSFTGDLRYRDLRRDTPYNTYTRRGLPPTPIAMPGAAAIRAATRPAETDALYFVARGDGTHQFSATLEAHNRAVVRYQLDGRSERLRRSD